MALVYKVITAPTSIYHQPPGVPRRVRAGKGDVVAFEDSALVLRRFPGRFRDATPAEIARSPYGRRVATSSPKPSAKAKPVSPPAATTPSASTLEGALSLAWPAKLAFVKAKGLQPASKKKEAVDEAIRGFFAEGSSSSDESGTESSESVEEAASDTADDDGTAVDEETSDDPGEGGEDAA